MKKLVTAAILTAVLLNGCGSANAVSAPVIQETGTLTAKKERAAVYTFESDANGFNTKTYFYDTGKEVVAFDAQFTPELARQSIEFIKSKTASPVKFLVVTHPNPDKFNGIPEFQKIGARVILSGATAKNMEGVHNYKKYFFVNIAKMFTEETYPKLPAGFVTFKENYDLKLGNGESVKIRELNSSGVSTNQTVAYIPSRNVLVAGDLVHHKAHAWLEGPVVNGKDSYSKTDWVNTLKKLGSIYKGSTIVLGGRGNDVPLAVAVAEQVNYLNKAETITRNYLLTLPGKDLQEKKQKVDYQALTKEFEKAFPGYKLGYMVTYGAYGLVNSIR